MARMRSAGLAITLAACVVVCAPLRAAPVSAELAARIDDLMREQMAITAVPGAALIITRGATIVYARGFGRDGDGQAFTPETPAYIGSLSKSFTAAAVMQLVALGRLTLDTRVVDVVPEFRLADP
jgi:CubicO group peptidase (beta-lactamase class C family)